MSFGVALPPAVPNTTHLRPSSPPLGPAAVLLINKDNGRGLAPPSRSQSTPTPRSEQHDTDSFQVLPIRPAPSGPGGDQRTRGWLFQLGSVLSGRFGHFSTQVGPGGSSFIRTATARNP